MNIKLLNFVEIMIDKVEKNDHPTYRMNKTNKCVVGVNHFDGNPFCDRRFVFHELGIRHSFGLGAELLSYYEHGERILVRLFTQDVGIIINKDDWLAVAKASVKEYKRYQNLHTLVQCRASIKGHMNFVADKDSSEYIILDNIQKQLKDYINTDFGKKA